jgi:hypothetical protein
MHCKCVFDSIRRPLASHASASYFSKLHTNSSCKSKVQEVPLKRMEDKKHVFRFQVAVDVAGAVEQHKPFNNLTSHDQHCRWKAFDIQPPLQGGTTVQNNEGRERVAAVADNPSIGIVMGIQELRQALAETLSIVQVPLQLVGAHIQIKSVHQASFQCNE